MQLLILWMMLFWPSHVQDIFDWCFINWCLIKVNFLNVLTHCENIENSHILSQKLFVILKRVYYVVVIARCRVQYGKYFPSFSYFSYFEITAIYEKRGRYLPILHEATCDNYFIVKCLLKSNMARAISLSY